MKKEEKMQTKIKQLKAYYDELFLDENIIRGSYIEIIDKEDELVLMATREGLLILIKQLIRLSDTDFSSNDGITHYAHYHLDEAGMANKCEKPVVISCVRHPRL